jgi:hypothetical protein
MSINIQLRRDGAKVEITPDGRAVFPGVGVAEYFSPQRYVPMLPLTAELTLRAGTLYKVFTGLGISRLAFDKIGGVDVRPRLAVFKKCGMRVERVEIDGPKDGEIIVYVTVLGEYAFDKSAELFESFALGQSQPTLEVLDTPVVDGFVPVATREITEQPRHAAAPKQPEESDEAKSRKFMEFLDADPKPSQTVEATQVSGALAPATAFVGKGGKPAIVKLVQDPDNAAQ